MNTFSPTFLRRAILTAKLVALLGAVHVTRGHGMASNLAAFMAGLLCAVLLHHEAHHVDRA
mgnify:CR=1 FL=1